MITDDLSTVKQYKPHHKFSAQQTVLDNIKFSSKAEAKYYQELKLLQAAGHVSFFLRQVPFHLTGGVIYRLDFMVFKSDGDIDFIDVKGFETKEFKIKKKILEELYPIRIKVVK